MHECGTEGSESSDEVAHGRKRKGKTGLGAGEMLVLRLVGRCGCG
jgi:hypothetical protein